MFDFLKNLFKETDPTEILENRGWKFVEDHWEKNNYRVVFHDETFWYCCPIGKETPRISGTVDSLEFLLSKITEYTDV